MEYNVFEKPGFYLNRIKQLKLIKENKQKRHTGKSVAVIFLTRYCSLKCAFCIYKSRPKDVKEINEKDEFSDYGCERVISFINESNIGYLLIAGGGEPFEKEECIYRILEQVEAERVVIATNGFWTSNAQKTEKILGRLNSILRNNKNIKDFIIRFSVDRWHQNKVELDGIARMIRIYSSMVEEKEKFKIELHTIIGDETIKALSKEIGKEIEINNSLAYVSDNKKLDKKSKKRSYIELPDGQRINIGYAKLFYPNLKIDLKQSKEKIDKVLQPFYEDIENSQDGNFSTVSNKDGSMGLDYLINFNGNVSTWGNYQLDNIPNLYYDSNSTINNVLYDDIISYSFIDMNLNERENIVKHINKLAVLRSAAINVRDYSGAYLLYEDKTALYYTIMIIRRYYNEGLIDDDDLLKLPSEIYDLIHQNEENIERMYQDSEFSIIEQYIENEEKSMEAWAAIFYLIKNGHFEVTQSSIDKALTYINEIQSQKFENTEDIINKYEEKIYNTIIDKMTIMPKNKSKLNI